MQKILKSVLDLIGNTPLMELPISVDTQNNATILAKLEMFNPTGSIKDRIALYMINTAEKRQQIKPGSTIIEATSGNTGASAALVAKAKGYHCLITTSEKTSTEKISIMRALGAEVKVCPSSAKEGDANHYITLAKRLHQQISNSYLLDQYNNQDNVMTHYHTTGPELWKQTNGNIDYLVACSSSGGTISGIAKYLKEKNANIKIIMPDPIGSIYHSYFKTNKFTHANVSTYKTEGVGKDFLCGCIDFSVIDEVVQFTDQMAFEACHELAANYSILAGGSSGAAYKIALNLAQSLKKKANIVVIFPDTGMKYLSKIFV